MALLLRGSAVVLAAAEDFVANELPRIRHAVETGALRGGRWTSNVCAAFVSIARNKDAPFAAAALALLAKHMKVGLTLTLTLTLVKLLAS